MKHTIIRTFNLVLSTILLWCLAIKVQAIGEPCGDGYAAGGDAQVCFSRHAILAESPYNPLPITVNLVSKPMEQGKLMLGLVDINVGQPCLISFSSKAWVNFVNQDGVPTTTLVNWFNAIQTLLAHNGRNDCVIEIPGNKPIGILYFTSSQGGFVIGKTPEGIFSERNITRIDRFSDTGGIEFPVAILAAVLKMPQSVEHTLLTQRGVSSRISTDYVVTLMSPKHEIRTFAVCSTNELVIRYPNSKGALKSILSRPTQQLAEATILPSTMQPIEVIAYVVRPYHF